MSILTVKNTSKQNRESGDYNWQCLGVQVGGIPETPEKGQDREPKHRFMHREPNWDPVAKRGIQARYLKARGQIRLQMQEENGTRSRTGLRLSSIWG